MKEELKKIPTWGWVAIGLVGVGVLWAYLKKRQAATASAALNTAAMNPTANVGALQAPVTQDLPTAQYTVQQLNALATADAAAYKQLSDQEAALIALFQGQQAADQAAQKQLQASLDGLTKSNSDLAGQLAKLSQPAPSNSNNVPPPATVQSISNLIVGAPGTSGGWLRYVPGGNLWETGLMGTPDLYYARIAAGAPQSAVGNLSDYTSSGIPGAGVLIPVRKTTNAA